MFEGLETEGDEEEELKQMVRGYQSRGGKLWSKEEAKGGEEGRGEGEDTRSEVSDLVRGAKFWKMMDRKATCITVMSLIAESMKLL